MHRPEIAGSARAFDLIRQTPTDAAPGERLVVVEAPVAIEVNGLGYAVMMATPADLEDFALGFALSERIIDDPADLKDVASHAIGEGWLLRLTIKDAAFAPIGERIRHRVADSGCGLCGMDNLEQVLRPLPPVQNPSQATPEALFRALTSLRDVQPLNAATGAAHAAAGRGPAPAPPARGAAVPPRTARCARW